MVPLRSFTLGKARLSDSLAPDARAALARRMASSVVAAAGRRRTVVVSSDPAVVAWAHARGVESLPDPGSLDGAADEGRRWARLVGAPRVVVAHADLPFATSLDGVATGGADAVAAIVPDHRGDGTPVLALPAAAPFRFSYGPGSFARHVAEAARVGLDVRVVRDDALGFDVDVPEDLARLELRAR